MAVASINCVWLYILVQDTKEWLELEEDAQKTYVMGLLDRLEVVSREQRLKVARAVLYLAQGKICWLLGTEVRKGRA